MGTEKYLQGDHPRQSMYTTNSDTWLQSSMSLLGAVERESTLDAQILFNKQPRRQSTTVQTGLERMKLKEQAPTKSAKLRDSERDSIITKRLQPFRSWASAQNLGSLCNNKIKKF